MFIEWKEHAFKSISHSFVTQFEQVTRDFSQNESSAWNGTGFINIAFAQDFACTVAGGYAATL